MASSSMKPLTRPIGPVRTATARCRGRRGRLIGFISLRRLTLRAVAVKTKITELPDSRVRLDAEVPSEEIESSLEHAARELGKELRVPGFRKGKVPAAMVIQRVGREAVLEQAVRDSLPRWYEQALIQADLNTVGDPKLNLEELPSEGEPLSFSIEVAVTPKAGLGDYKGVEVGRREPDVPPDVVDQEIERLRDGFARVESVDRPLESGDLAVGDCVGKLDGEPFEGGEARDYMLEIGSGRLVEGFEEQLVGASAGETRNVEIDFPADYPADELRGKAAVFDVQVKDVKRKELPELSDEFASEASEFDTLAELRADIEQKLEQAQSATIDEEFRGAVVDAVAQEAQLELSDELVAARAHELWHRTERALARAGRDPEAFLKTAGRTHDQMVEEAKPDAAKQLARESVLEAVAEAESIEVSDEELLDALEPAAEAEGASAQKVLERLKQSGRDAPLRHDLRLRKAADFLVEHAQPIGVEQAKAREKLWTPEKEREPGAGSLWTPGDEPPQGR
jgi:trigger factor